LSGRRRIYIGLSALGGALVGAALVILVILIVTGSISASQARKVEPFSLVREPLAGELAGRFRPWLLFDSREKWRPLNVDSLFDEGTQRFCLRRGRVPKCIPIRNAAEFDALVAGKQAGPATYIDIKGDSTNSYHGPASCRPLLDCDSGPRSAIYYNATESNGRYYLDYWWFLRFNHFARLALNESCLLPVARETGVCDEHEGDWEGVTVVTRPHDERHVEYVVYAAHKGTFRYSGGRLKFRDGTRPVVYLAEGGHAAYPLPCRHSCHQPAGLAVDGVLELPESDYDGLAEWGRDAEACVPNTQGSCLLSLDKQHWTHWPGEWGAGCTAACGGVVDANSPHSPGVQARFQTPWCSFQEDVFTCDGRSQHCADWLGSQVVAVACDPILLTIGQRSSKKLGPGALGLDVAGKPIENATTPGVVQALGAPLEPPSRLSAIADGPATEILVRAAQGRLVSSDLFTNPGWRPGQTIHLTVTSGTDGPTVLADGHPATERTITERPTPANLNRALRVLAPGP
jgi:Vacuolar protein sorting-associated protein 62